MGNYAAYTDVQNEFRSLQVDSNTTINQAKVDEFITEEEAKIDGYLAGQYIVPITGTVSLALMKLMTVFAVKARVLDILSVKTGNKVVDQSGGDSKSYYEKVYGIDGNLETGLIADIKNRKLILGDAVATQSGGGVQSYTGLNSIKPFFKRRVKQW